MSESRSQITVIARMPAFLVFAADHDVPLYSVAETALPSLAVYIEACLRNEEACIVVATTPYLDKLGEVLREKSMDLFSARKRGQYIVVCPQRQSRITTTDKLPNSTLTRTLKTVRALAKNSTRPVQVFSEPWLFSQIASLT